MIWQDAIVAAVLAVLVGATSARATRLLVADRITARPRNAVQWWAERRWSRKKRVPFRDVQQMEEWQSGLAYFVGCSWCTGLYVAGAATLVTDMTVSVSVPFLVWGVSAYAAGKHGGE